MSYKDALIRANTILGKDPKTRFIGYGLKKTRAMGTLAFVNEKKIIEMPTAENLLMGFAIGMSLKGYKPVVYIERMDFLLNCLDAIVNHLDKIETLSKGEFAPAVLIRCIVGNKNKPLFTGSTHTQDLSEAIEKMVSFPVIRLTSHENVFDSYFNVAKTKILVEYKDLM